MFRQVTLFDCVWFYYHITFSCHKWVLSKLMSSIFPLLAGRASDVQCWQFFGGNKHGYCWCTEPILVSRVVWAQIIGFVDGGGGGGTPASTDYARKDTNNLLLSQTLLNRLSEQQRVKTGINSIEEIENSSMSCIRAYWASPALGPRQYYSCWTTPINSTKATFRVTTLTIDEKAMEAIKTLK